MQQLEGSSEEHLLCLSKGKAAGVFGAGRQWHMEIVKKIEAASINGGYQVCIDVSYILASSIRSKLSSSPAIRHYGQLTMRLSRKKREVCSFSAFVILLTNAVNRLVRLALR